MKHINKYCALKRKRRHVCVSYFKRCLKSCFPKTRRSSQRVLTFQENSTQVVRTSTEGQHKLHHWQDKKITSSVVKAWSFIGREAGSSKLIEVTEPRISRGVSDQIKFVAEETFLKVVSPSSYLQQECN